MLELSRKNRVLLLGLVLTFIPGSGIVYGLYLIKKVLRKKPRTVEDFINELRKEAGIENREKNNN